MTKPPDDFDPKDRLPLRFTKPDSGKVLPFGKRAKPPEPVRPVPPKTINFELTDEEVKELNSFFNLSKPAPVKARDIEDTPVALLEHLIQRIKSGDLHTVGMFVGMIVYKPNGTEDYPFFCTGLSRLAVKGLLQEYLENLP